MVERLDGAPSCPISGSHRSLVLCGVHEVALGVWQPHDEAYGIPAFNWIHLGIAGGLARSIPEVLQ